VNFAHFIANFAMRLVSVAAPVTNIAALTGNLAVSIANFAAPAGPPWSSRPLITFRSPLMTTASQRPAEFER